MIQKVAPQRHGMQLDQGRKPVTPTEITTRLAAEFPELEHETVSRWVLDTLACARHLGMGADPHVIERLTREHLISIVHSPISAPPSRAATVGPQRVGGDPFPPGRRAL